MTFFGYFENAVPDLKCVGFPAPPVVSYDEFEELKRREPMSRAFAAKKNIDIIITSLASAQDEHGDLTAFMKLVAPRDHARILRRQEIAGDVQYNPYSAEGPVHLATGSRVATLYELDELCELARKKNKYVLLVAGPCGRCDRTRTDALLPLMQNPKLKCWTQLVLDLDTAEELLRGAGPQAPSSA